MPDFTDMLSKAKEMQTKMKEAQDAIKKIEVEYGKVVQGKRSMTEKKSENEMVM